MGTNTGDNQQHNVEGCGDQGNTQDSPSALGVGVAGVDVHDISLSGGVSIIKPLLSAKELESRQFGPRLPARKNRCENPAFIG